MSAELHPLAPHTLPSFIGAADGSDPLFSAITVILVLAVLGIGIGYLSLHAIPERLAHKHGNTQTTSDSCSYSASQEGMAAIIRPFHTIHSAK